MKLVTAQEMQEIDRRTIEGGHVPSRELMERAGAAVADAVLDAIEEIDAPQVEILCGKGNNGGDGLVVGRLLAASEIGVRVWLTHTQGLSPDAQSNLEILRQTDCLIAEIPAELQDPGEVAPHNRPFRESADMAGQFDAATQQFRDALLGSDLCVDALLGTGIQHEVKGRYRAILNTMNACCAHVLAVDIPSGVDGSTGEVHGTSCWADRTVTIGLPKLGLVFHPGASRTGQLQVVDIGFPEKIVQAIPTTWEYMDEQLARRMLPRPDPTVHKYERGALLLIAGSRRYPGAAALAAEAALRSGAGLVHLVVPNGISDLVNGQLREVIVHGAPETADGSLHPDAYDLLVSLSEKVRAVAIGPGLSDDAQTQTLVARLVEWLPHPHIVDADALTTVPGLQARAPRVLTPHVGEMAKMLKLPSPQVAQRRVDLAQQMATEQRCTVLSKGAPTVVALQDGRRIVNSTGNVGLATAGSGDVLTGLLGGLLAQGVQAAAAASLAAYLHGRAAEILSDGFAPQSLLAGDLLQGIGLALANLSAR